jgi:hypothetical protein
MAAELGEESRPDFFLGIAKRSAEEAISYAREHLIKHDRQMLEYAGGWADLALRVASDNETEFDPDARKKLFRLVKNDRDDPSDLFNDALQAVQMAGK